MSGVAAREDRRSAGIALMIAAFAFFTCIDASAKWLVQAGMPAMQVVFVRYAVHMAMVAVLFLPQEGLGLFRSDAWGAEAMRSFFLLASTIFNFLAVIYLPLTLTAAIFFTVPLWVCALSVPLLGERVGPRRWAAILIGFCGVLIVTRPWSAEAHWAVLLSIGAAICASLYIILTRRLAGVDSTATQQFYAAALASLAIAPVAFADWHWPETQTDWTAFALIGVVGWAGHQLLTVAHRFAPASTLAPFVYVQIIFMTAASWLIFSDPPDPWVFVGAAVVLLSGLYIWLRERQIEDA
ncbi:MAG: DMT family transporter [Pseudomonadota bacterium]